MANSSFQELRGVAISNGRGHFKWERPFQMGGAISNGRDHFKWEGHFKQVLTRSHIWLVRLASTQVGGKNKLKGPQFDSSW
jgi:hypothetical protein